MISPDARAEMIRIAANVARTEATAQETVRTVAITETMDPETARIAVNAVRTEATAQEMARETV